MSSTNVGGSLISGSEASSSSGGLGAGIDVSTLVQAAMAPQNAELAVMQSQQSTLTTQQTALTSFNNDLQTLQNAVFALTDPVGQLTAIDATSSNPSILTGSAVSVRSCFARSKRRVRRSWIGGTPSSLCTMRRI